MKTFTDIREPVKVELTDYKGNKSTKTAKFLSNDDCKKISLMYKKYQGEEGDENDPDGSKRMNIAQEQMAEIFGGKSKDYGIYSPSLMKEVLTFVTRETINPTNQVQENSSK